jgi:hypothetical protein
MRIFRWARHSVCGFFIGPGVRYASYKLGKVFDIQVVLFIGQDVQYAGV